MFSDSYQQRFGGIIRLYGTALTKKLQASHILVIGIGGVGSWVAEALARTGIGEITLMDMDDICVTNSNRQVHTTAEVIGQSKIEVMAERLRGINPEIIVHTVDDFLDKENLLEVVSNRYTIVVDAIDSTTVKTELVAHCKRQKIPCLTIGSAGGKTDPTQITYGDLSKTVNDPLLARMRNNLRRKHNFSRNPKRVFSVEAIYSTEQMTYPDDNGETCQHRGFLSGGEKLDCSGGFGAATMVTAGFAFVACARVVEKISKIRLSSK